LDKDGNYEFISSKYANLYHAEDLEVITVPTPTLTPTPTPSPGEVLYLFLDANANGSWGHYKTPRVVGRIITLQEEPAVGVEVCAAERCYTSDASGRVVLPFGVTQVEVRPSAGYKYGSWREPEGITLSLPAIFALNPERDKHYVGVMYNQQTIPAPPWVYTMVIQRNKCVEGHMAYDMGTLDDIIISPVNGTIWRVYDQGPKGFAVYVQTTDGYIYGLGHLGEVHVKEGQRVTRKTIIGTNLPKYPVHYHVHPPYLGGLGACPSEFWTIGSAELGAYPDI
jgi:hypothetical protein